MSRRLSKLGISSFTIKNEPHYYTTLKGKKFWNLSHTGIFLFVILALMLSVTVASAQDTPTLEVKIIGVLEGNTDERTITHSYGEDEAPTEYTLTLIDGTAAPDWISISDGKVMVAPSYDVVEPTAAHEIFDFMISTVGKTPNAIGEFRVVVINNSETPIIYDGGLDAVTVNEDSTGDHDILGHYTSSISSTLILKNNYPGDADAGTENDDHLNSNAPNWVSFRVSGIIVTPGNSEVGTHQVPFKVIDGLGNELTGTLALTVINVNDAPTIVDKTQKPLVRVLENLECGAIGSGITETFDLSTVFYDVDANDVLAYELIADDDPDDGHDGVVGNVKVSNPDFVSLEEGASGLTFTFTADSENYRGFHNIGIKTTDTSGESVTGRRFLLYRCWF